jgi:phosphate starvation-inducible PhoH-like protein
MSKNSKKKNKKISENDEYDYYESFATTKNYNQPQTDGSRKNNYENFQYLSIKEKMIFENKFSKPKNNSQEKYLIELNKETNKIIIATGPAGTGKTLLGTEYAIKNFLLGNCEKLIFTRPSVCVDENLGYLPGTLEEKLAPYIRPIYDILYSFISPKEVSELIEAKTIEISPLGFMRGRTFKNCWIVADEMQNSTQAQMKMLLTRIGENSKIIITGDLDQCDKKFELNGLGDFLNKMKGKRSCSISSVEFDAKDVEREPVVKEILEIYNLEFIPSIYDNDDLEIISQIDELLI